MDAIIHTTISLLGVCLVCLFVSIKANKCKDALGMESGEITEDQISASSQFHKINSSPNHARLNGDSAWRPAEGTTDQWIQVDFERRITVTAVSTQGRHDGGMIEYVTSYKVAYSLDTLVWLNITDENGEDKVFDGNYDRDTIVNQMFTNPVRARHIRIYPIACEHRCGLRFELYGCNANECEDALGMQSGVITDSQISASSQFPKIASTPSHARLHGDSAWRPEDDTTNQWIQVDFEQNINVTAVATQGRHDGGMLEYVMSYKVAYSADTLVWIYIAAENGEDKIFDGNYDRDTIVDQTFLNPVTVRYIRIYPQECEHRCGLRFELYGCNVTTSIIPSTISTAKTTSTNANTSETVTSSNNMSTPVLKSTTSKGVQRAIVGSVIGILVILIIAVIAAVWFFKRGNNGICYRRSYSDHSGDRTSLAL